MYRWSALFLLFGSMLVALAGCKRGASQGTAGEAPAIPVSHPVQRDVIDYAYFTGRMNAINSVNIVPRVTGYLTKMPFKEGSEVKAGDLLFEIDPRPYQAQYDQAVSQLSFYKAQLDLAKKTAARFKDLDVKTPGAVSKLELDQYQAAVVEADARVAQAEKSLEVYQLNKDFTQVTSPIGGQVGSYNWTFGNLVNQDQTLLTTVVSLDPMYVNFDLDEQTLDRINEAINAGRLSPLEAGKLPVYLETQAEQGFPHRGTINFLNNRVDANTGSIPIRGIVSNPRQPGGPYLAPRILGYLASPLAGPLLALPPPISAFQTGVRALTPGRFVRVQLPISKPYKALLVIDRAIQSDQGQKYLYVIDADGKVQYRRITTGALQDDGLRVIGDLRISLTKFSIDDLRKDGIPEAILSKLPPMIDLQFTKLGFHDQLTRLLGKQPADLEAKLLNRAVWEGLEPTDLVVVGGVQQVRPRMTAKTEEIAMPLAVPPVAPPPKEPEKPAAKQEDKPKGK